MKTTRLYSASLLLLATLFVTGLNALTPLPRLNEGNPPSSETAYVNLMPDFDFEDEAYIDDIPFDTECVSRNCIYQKAISVEYTMSEEGYIDDIPFSTEKVSMQADKQKTLQTEFALEDEEYINDIPFSTRDVVIQNNSVQLTRSK